MGQLLRSHELSLARRVDEAFERFALHEAVSAVGEFVREINRYLDATAPWTLASCVETAQLGVVLRRAIEATRTAATYYAPIIPRATAAALERLETDPPRHGPPLFPRLA